MHRLWRISLPWLVALAVLLLALPVGRISLAAWSRITEETHEETRGHTDPVKIESTASANLDARGRRHRLLPRRHLITVTRPSAHVRLQFEAPARRDSYKRPLRC